MEEEEEEYDDEDEKEPWPFLFVFLVDFRAAFVCALSIRPCFAKRRTMPSSVFLCVFFRLAFGDLFS